MFDRAKADAEIGAGLGIHPDQAEFKANAGTIKQTKPQQKQR